MTQTPIGSAVPTGPPSPPPPGRPPLRRRREGRIIGGVAAGLADHLDVDVAIVRILFVVVGVLTIPFGFLAYLLGVLFIPVAKPGELPPSPSTSRSNAAGDSRRVGREPAFWVGVALLVVGALWILGGPLAPTRLVPGLIGRDLLWPLVLIAFGLALWRASDRSTTPLPPRNASTPPAASAPMAPAPWAATPAPPHPSDMTETTVSTNDTIDIGRPTGRDGTTEPMGGGPSGYDPGYDGAPIPPTPPMPPTGSGGGQQPSWSPPPERSRGRSLLTQLTLGVAFVVVGVGWLLDAMNVITTGPGRLAAAGLLVIGVGLLVGSVVGRGRWLILFGGLLIPVVVAAELLRPYGFHDFPRFDARGPHGQLAEVPASLDDLADSYRLGGGTITLDLRDLELDEPATTRVTVGAGEILVRLPEDATVDVAARVGVGELTINGRSTGGFGQNRSQRIDVGEGSEELMLDLRVGFGQIDVIAPPPAALSLPDDAAPAMATR